MPLRLPALYPLTDESLADSLETQVARLGAVGFSLIQVRAKALPSDRLMDALRGILARAEADGGWPRVVVNDRADLALLLAKDGLRPWGLHLGQGDLPPRDAQALPGLGDVHLGTSTHADAEWADVDPACDHAGVGPFRATATKGDHAAPIGIEGLRRGCAALRSRGVAPIAIGGLTLNDAETCFQAGAESLAMVGTVHASEDPRSLGWEAQGARWRARAPLQRGQGLVLIGASGSGKSTLGPHLGRGMGLPFFDLDQEIEAEEGASVSSLFQDRGEAAFRQLESRMLQNRLAHPAVVSLGGGAWEAPGNRDLAARAGFKPLWLAEPPRACWARVAGDARRPLAHDEGNFMARCRHRMEAWSREEAVSSFGRSPEALAQVLLNHVG